MQSIMSQELAQSAFFYYLVGKALAFAIFTLFAIVVSIIERLEK